MIYRLIQKELKTNKVAIFTLFIFVFLSAMLASSAIVVVTELNNSLNSFFEQAKVPSYTQMYAGQLSEKEIHTFVKNNELVKQQQTVTMLSISGENLFLQDSNNSEINSIIENSFVKQNTKFDFLLDTNNNIAKVEDDYIGIPVYHKQQYQLEIGSKIQVKIGDFKKTYTISCFTRDAQMNPSLVTSKRLLVSDNDWNTLKEKLSNQEYLIEFELKEEQTISEFEKQYQASNLPQSGTALTRSLYQMLNSLTDGIIVAIIILISLLLLLIALLCLRFTILTAIEEEYREIGIMKAIGISTKSIKKIYSTKYMVLAASACIMGYFCSLGATQWFTKPISIYMGTTTKSWESYLLTVLGAISIFLFIYFFCSIIFRRFKRISAYHALQAQEKMEYKQGSHKIKLSGKKYRIININIFIGIREVLTRIKVYIVLTLIFASCLFLITVPLNILQTIQSPTFISYMGAGKSDLRIDIHQVQEYPEEFFKLQKYLKNDKYINKIAIYTTGAYQIKNKDGELETIKIESTNDYSAFPLTYTKGVSPQNKEQIALSSMNSDELGLTVGDKLSILIKGKERRLIVSGIYQDVTNGGKTAKGMLPVENVLWHTINFNVDDATQITNKKMELQQQFEHSKIIDTEEYIYQTLDGIIQQVSSISIGAFILSLCLAILITSMFFRMILAKEIKDVAIMKSLGISFQMIQQQYLARGILPVMIGIIIGTMGANLLGTKIAALLLPGVSNLTFVINPLINYVMIPLVLLMVVSISIYFVSLLIKNIKVIEATQ